MSRVAAGGGSPARVDDFKGGSDVYMVAAFRGGKLVSEVGGDGTGLANGQAVHFARDLRAEFPDAVVAILPSKSSWLGGWPWTFV